GRVLPGILSREGGIFACKLGGSHSRVYTADLYGKSIWQLYMAGLFGGSKGLICSKMESKKTFFGCRSAQFSRFMLPPRHIQGA
ncbi:MAG: hypothetical protein ACK55Z_09480, partial [bacterium]